ncbi:MAG: GDP-mannose 4,6-dehydratase [Actinomycetota bacterium]|nr:GDP-mannose 4,6-dehydratase [Actinomycetota bacterium]
MNRRALITGVSGQDGSHLAELLLSKGYEVHGLIRRSSSISTTRLDGIYQGPEVAGRSFVLHYGDLTDGQSLARLVADIQPDEVYNLGAQSHVAVSFEIPEFTFDVTGQGALRLLEAVRNHAPAARFYQASSSEMFGSAPPPQNEQTAFHPRSPYAVAKVAAHYATQNYREAYGLFACAGILFNHEGERRGETFVTQKIARGAARIGQGRQSELLLGNLDARRDWGHAVDYVHAMWLMLRADAPDDYVIATGEAHSVREFCQLAFARVGLDWERYVKVDERYLRPSEVDHLCGDSTKARTALGWQPDVSFEQLVHRMVDAQLENES